MSKITKYAVSLPALMVSKVALYESMRDQKIGSDAASTGIFPKSIASLMCTIRRAWTNASLRLERWGNDS